MTTHVIIDGTDYELTSELGAAALAERFRKLMVNPGPEPDFLLLQGNRSLYVNWANVTTLEVVDIEDIGVQVF